MKYLSSLINSYFSRNALPYWGVLIVDCICVFLAGIAAFAINHGLREVYDASWALLLVTLVMVFCYGIGFKIFHTYRGVVRYSSFKDLVNICLAVIVGLAITILVELLTGLGHQYVLLKIGDIVLTGLLVISVMWLIRVFLKSAYDSVIGRERTQNVFIYGVKYGGVAIAKSINAQHNSTYRIRGFASSEPDIKGKYLMGHKVYHFGPTLIDDMKRENARILLVSPIVMDKLHENDETVNALIDAGIKIFVMPKAREWDGKGDLDINEMRQIELTDLLPRDTIEIDMKAAADMLEGRRVLITGAAGSIGSEIVRQVAQFGPSELILIDQAETPMHDIRLMMHERWPQVKAVTIVADIADPAVMRRIFREHQPEYVFHAAAYKHVPMMEDNPYGAVVNNVKGTKIVADLAVEYRTRKFVMVSTDKAVNPTNVMGASKRICEIYVQSLDKAVKDGDVKGVTQFVTTRFGNVLGSNGSVIPIFQEQIRKGGPVTVTHPEIIRYFMLIPEACRLVVEAGTMGRGGELYVFDMGEPVKIADLARRMIRLSGRNDIEIKFTGLRDGEKLYEEVLDDKETTLPTFHPKIKIAKVRQYDYAVVNRDIENLVDDAAGCSDMEIVGRMKRIVPEFKSQHSKYQALDA